MSEPSPGAMSAAQSLAAGNWLMSNTPAAIRLVAEQIDRARKRVAAATIKPLPVAPPAPPAAMNEKFLAAITRLAVDDQPFQIAISKIDLWQMLCQLQLAFRHPLNVGPSRETVARIANGLAAALIANDLDLRKLWDMGNTPYFDTVWQNPDHPTPPKAA